MNRKSQVNVTSFVRSPYTPVRIHWEADGASGSTVCPAWRGQYEIESLERAGYKITDVTAA